jgi:hypothetical protein
LVTFAKQQGLHLDMVAKELVYFVLAAFADQFQLRMA